MTELLSEVTHEQRLDDLGVRLTKLEGKGKPPEPWPVVVCAKCGKQWPEVIVCRATPDSELICTDCITARPKAPEGYRFTGEWREVDVTKDIWLVGNMACLPNDSICPDPYTDGGKRWILEKIEPEKPEIHDAECCGTCDFACGWTRLPRVYCTH